MEFEDVLSVLRSTNATAEERMFFLNRKTALVTCYLLTNKLFAELQPESLKEVLFHTVNHLNTFILRKLAREYNINSPEVLPELHENIIDLQPSQTIWVLMSIRDKLGAAPPA